MPYLPRLVDPVLDDAMAGLPAVLLVGPRATGKTTSARRHARSVLRLDQPAQAMVVRADPDAAIADRPSPLLIDEWQLVPEVLGAVKRSIDDAPVPGRYILTGSVRAELTGAGWPATGRVVRIPMLGLTQRELHGATAARSVISRWFEGDPGPGRLPLTVPDLRDYIAMALQGGFPEVALRVPQRLRSRWLGGYVDQVIGRDAQEAGQDRDPRRLLRYLQAIAANTAGVVDHKTLYDAAGIDRQTAVAYDSLLEVLFVTEQVPAWSTNRISRLTRAAKRYLVEPALVGPLIGLDEQGALRDIDVLGRLLDTFVIAQLRAELDVADPRTTMHHLRLEHGRREVDLVLEAADGRVVGVEVKASAAPTAAMARHLMWLRDEFGEAFVLGVLLHTGPAPIRLAPKIVALPIWTLWAADPVG